MFCIIISGGGGPGRGWIKGQNACFACLILLVDGDPENFENQKCRRSHLRPFCNAIKVLRFPEFSLFVDVSEKSPFIYAFKCL